MFFIVGEFVLVAISFAGSWRNMQGANRGMWGGGVSFRPLASTASSLACACCWAHWRETTLPQRPPSLAASPLPKKIPSLTHAPPRAPTLI